MPKADFITSIVLLVFSITVVWMSIEMPRLENRNVNPLTVPGIVPGFLGVVIGIFALILLERSIRHQGYRLGLSGEKVGVFCRKDSSLRMFGTIALGLFYAWGLIGRVPYPVSTFLFVFLFIVIFEYAREDTKVRKRKKILIAAVMSLLVSGIVSAVFRYLFLVKLP